MSTLILTQQKNTYANNTISLNNHTWDVSAKPFIPNNTNAMVETTSTLPSSSRVIGGGAGAAAATSPEYGFSRRPKSVMTPKNCGPDPVTSMFKSAVSQNVHMGNRSVGGSEYDEIRPSSSSYRGSLSSSSSTLHSSFPYEAAAAPRTTSTLPSKTAAAAAPPRATSTTTTTTLHPPHSVNLCEKPTRKTPLMSTTEYFMERWNSKNEITSVTHAMLEGTYLESRKNPTTSTVPSLFGNESPFPPVLINQLPSLMSIWKIPYESESFTAGILGAHPEFAIQLFRHD